MRSHEDPFFLNKEEQSSRQAVSSVSGLIPNSLPARSALIQWWTVCNGRLSARATSATLCPALTNRTASSLRSLGWVFRVVDGGGGGAFLRLVSFRLFPETSCMGRADT